MRSLRTAALSGAALLLLGLAPAAADAALLGGGATDPGSDAHNNAQDLRAVAVVYDTSGVVKASVVTTTPAFDPFVSAVEVSVGTASKQRGTCALRFDADIFTANPGDDDSVVFAQLNLDHSRLRFNAVTQDERTLTIDTSQGDASSQIAGGPIPQIAHQRWNCALVRTFGPKESKKVKGDYAIDDATDVFPLIAGGPKTPHCTTGGTLRRGTSAKLRCSAAHGKVTVRFHRNQKLVKTRTVRLHGNGGRVTTAGLARGRNDVSIWQGDALIGTGSLKLR